MTHRSMEASSNERNLLTGIVPHLPLKKSEVELIDLPECVFLQRNFETVLDLICSPAKQHRGDCAQKDPDVKP